MIFIQTGTTLIFLLFITLIVLNTYKKLNSEDKSTFKSEFLYETGILFVSHSLLVISLVFQNSILMKISITLILFSLSYLGILNWKENKNRSILLFTLILFAACISVILLN